MELKMSDFPEFMKNPRNRIDTESQFSRGIEGYIYDGADGGQMAFWTCKEGGTSAEHVHDYDEYFVVIEGLYILIMDGREIPVPAGGEYFIPRGVAHAGEYIAGTRTIHAFGGRRARRVGDWG